MEKKQVSNQINRMKNLMSYGLQSENKKIPYSSIESQMEGADGKMYGIVREGANYYIKVAPKKDKLIREDFDYINGFTHRAENRYNSYAKAAKDLELKLISIREAHAGGKNIVIESWNPKASENYSQEMTDKMRKEILRERRIMENVAIIETTKNATTNPEADMPGLKDAMSPKCKKEKPELGDGPDADGVFTDKVKDGTMKDVKGKIKEEIEASEDVDVENPLQEGDDVDEEYDIDDDDTDADTDGEDIDDDTDDAVDGDDIDDDDTDGDADVELEIDADDDDDERIDRIEDLVAKIADKLGLGDDDIDTSKYEDDDLFDDEDGDDDDDDDLDDVEGDEDDDIEDDVQMEGRRRNAPRIFESKAYRRAMREATNEFGNHPSFRKQPFTLPKDEFTDKEGYYGKKDDAGQSKKPFATKKGNSTPFTVDIDSITDTIEECVRGILKKKDKRG